MYCTKCRYYFAMQRLDNGVCMECWLDMTPAQRAAAKGEEPPVEKVVETEYRTINHRYSEGTPIIVICLWIFRVVVGVTLAMLWRKVM